MPTIHPGPGRYKLVPLPEWDAPPIFVEVSPDGMTLDRDDMPEFTYSWDGGGYSREAGGVTFSIVCYGSTWARWSTHGNLPPTLLGNGHCEPA